MVPITLLLRPTISSFIYSNSFLPSDPQWADISSSKRKELGFTNEDDGEFWMEYEDLLSNFDNITICRVMNTDISLTRKRVYFYFCLFDVFRKDKFWLCKTWILFLHFRTLLLFILLHHVSNLLSTYLIFVP